MLTSPRPAAPPPLPSECGRWLSPQKPRSGLPRLHACADPSSHFARSSQSSGAPHLSTTAARGTLCDCWAGWSSAHVPGPLSPRLHGLQDQPLRPPQFLCVQLRVPPTPQHVPVASALAIPTCPHLFQTLALPPEVLPLRHENACGEKPGAENASGEKPGYWSWPGPRSMKGQERWFQRNAVAKQGESGKKYTGFSPLLPLISFQCLNLSNALRSPSGQGGGQR